MERLPADQESGGAGSSGTFEGLKRADSAWHNLRHMTTGPRAGPAPQIVTEKPGSWRSDPNTASTPPPTASLPAPADTSGFQTTTPFFDVVVCGGTLGIFVATSLAAQGKSVAVVERGPLQGRTQEWNVSEKELRELLACGVVETQEELDACVAIKFNPNRCGFFGGQDIFVKDILNLGVSPRLLIDTVRRRFESLGGTVFEGAGVRSISVHQDGALLHLDSGQPMAARLVIDAMGNFSPIVRQVRWGQRPDGVCLVVGSCARGFPAKENTGSDIICTNSPLQLVGGSPCQLFWEAFPAGSSPEDRTTYLFSYLDADPSRPSLQQLLEVYWDAMPAYQNVRLEDLQFLRVLFGFFPTYRDSPMRCAFDRVLQVGDASGIQSPLSFGGFGSITRHLGRLTAGIVDALDNEQLSKHRLSLINPYQPNLSGAWLLQRAMSARSDSPPAPLFISSLLDANFLAMERLGDPVIRPFLQDVTQFSPLALTMGTMVLTRPQLLPQIFLQVGAAPLLDWLLHFLALALYTVAASALSPRIRPWVETLPPGDRFVWRRRLEAWKYGAGLDYEL